MISIENETKQEIESIIKKFKTKLSVDNIKLEISCEACPEQYEAFYNNIQIAYLRLRHGNFTVTVPYAFGNLVYNDNPEGDGMFMDYEREKFLMNAKNAIAEFYNNKIDKR